MTYKISLSAVRIPDEAYPLIYDTLRSEKIGQSEYVQRFENDIAEFVGVKHCVAVSNGTMADAVAVAAMKEKYKIKRVVVPALTFIAQPNSVRYNNLPVVFEDVTDDWQMRLGDYFQQETLYFPADLMGRTFNIPDAFSKDKMEFVIEDACEAFGTMGENNKFAGTFGKLGTYSFFPSHTISTGEGGAIVTDDDELNDLCRSLRAHGSISVDPLRKFQFPYLGFNARMTSMQAALGIALMKHIDEYLYMRGVIFAKMQDALGGFDNRPGDTFVVPHAYPVEYVSTEARDKAMRKLIEAGVECRKFFSCIPISEPPYVGGDGKFPNAERIAGTHLYVPCHQNMTPEDVTYILSVLDKIGGRA